MLKIDGERLQTWACPPLPTILDYRIHPTF